MEELARYNVLIGRTANKNRVHVDVRLESLDGAFLTTDHQQVDHVTRFAIMGTVTAYREREAHSAGQIRRYLDDIVEPATGWTAETIARLSQIWEQWHLNDMNAACDHQTVVSDGIDPAPCPITGYRYGSAWLTRPLPGDIVTEIQDMFGTA